MSNEPSGSSHRRAPVADTVASRDLQYGTVCSYEPSAGFGYVENERKQHRYIFLVGRAIRHTDARGMRVGDPVAFRVEANVRVTELRRL